MIKKITVECACDGCGEEKTLVKRGASLGGYTSVVPPGWKSRAMGGDGTGVRRGSKRKLLCAECNAAVTRGANAALKKRAG